MPFFHGVFSAAAVAGSGGAALAAWADWSTRPHSALVAGVAMVLVAVFARGLPRVGAERTRKRETTSPSADSVPHPARTRRPTTDAPDPPHDEHRAPTA
jgi:hypothetical protein